MLIGGQPSLATARDSHYETPLSIAVSKGHLEVIKVLLSRGLRIQDDPNAAYLNASAVYHDHFEVLRFLLDHGSDPNSGIDVSESGLHRAATENRVAFVDLLITHGAQVDAEYPNGSTPLFNAAGACSLDATLVLLQAGANPNHARKRDDSGGEPFPIDTAVTASGSVGGDCPGVVSALLEAGADVSGSHGTGLMAISGLRGRFRGGPAALQIEQLLRLHGAGKEASKFAVFDRQFARPKTDAEEKLARMFSVPRKIGALVDLRLIPAGTSPSRAVDMKVIWSLTSEERKALGASAGLSEIPVTARAAAFGHVFEIFGFLLQHNMSDDARQRFRDVEVAYVDENERLFAKVRLPSASCVQHQSKLAKARDGATGSDVTLPLLEAMTEFGRSIVVLPVNPGPP
jgi:hypothetical protein